MFVPSLKKTCLEFVKRLPSPLAAQHRHFLPGREKAYERPDLGPFQDAPGSRKTTRGSCRPQLAIYERRDFSPSLFFFLFPSLFPPPPSDAGEGVAIGPRLRAPESDGPVRLGQKKPDESRMSDRRSWGVACRHHSIRSNVRSPLRFPFRGPREEILLGFISDQPSQTCSPRPDPNQRGPGPSPRPARTRFFNITQRRTVFPFGSYPLASHCRECFRHVPARPIPSPTPL